jgi:predicted transcriptional regulator
MIAIMLSVKPNHLKNILNGDKTLEIRKKVPSINYYKVLLYCSKSKLGLYRNKENGKYFCNTSKNINDNKLNGKVVCEFMIKNEPKIYDMEWYKNDTCCYMDIKQIFLDEDEPWCEGLEESRTIISIEEENINDCELLKKSCLTFNELGAYLGEGGVRFYALEISDLKIYGKPKELKDFGIIKAPQNFVYIKGETK